MGSMDLMGKKREIKKLGTLTLKLMMKNNHPSNHIIHCHQAYIMTNTITSQIFKSQICFISSCVSWCGRDGRRVPTFNRPSF